jgi:hypothetical protein
MSRHLCAVAIAVTLAVGFLVDHQRPASADAGVLTEAQGELLGNSRYVYISSQRKDGSFGSPAEIWYLFHDGAVWVGTPPKSWRARRIKAGRPDAKIAIGKIDGPSFRAKGEIVKDTKVEELLFTTFANKYSEGWPRHEQSFRSGFKDGSRILIKYTPVK